MNPILFKLIFMVRVVVIIYFIKIRSFFKVLIINYKEIEISSTSNKIQKMTLWMSQSASISHPSLKMTVDLESTYQNTSRMI
jgi:hypothetical protein